MLSSFPTKNFKLYFSLWSFFGNDFCVWCEVKLVGCCSWLILAQETWLLIFQVFESQVTLHWLLKLNHGWSICITGTVKCYKPVQIRAFFVSFCFFLRVGLPAQHWVAVLINLLYVDKHFFKFLLLNILLLSNNLTCYLVIE